jgi:DNA-binding LytR/AlgR family response regulator
MKINCLIADDEELAREVLENYIQKVDGLNLVKSCRDGLEVFNILKRQSVDLLFLDIHMPELTGIELLKTLKNPPAVILTTAYREFALEGYALNVLDYLLKPMSFERFLRSVNKFTALKGSPVKLSSGPTQNDVTIEQFAIYIKSDRKLIRISVDEILYIEGMKNSVKVFTKDKAVVTYQTLSHFEAKLPGDLFCRVHRSFIVSLNHISSLLPSSLEIAETTIPVGITYRKEVYKKLKISLF